MKDARNTLRSAFQRRGVHQSVWDNIAPWADNDVFPLWVDQVRPFYRWHWEQLDLSGRGRQTFVYARDLEYLEAGVARWLQAEPEVAGTMNAYCEALAEKAFYLGQASEILKDPRYLNDSAYHRMREFDVTAHGEQARLAHNIAINAKKQAREKATLRLFSAIDAQQKVADPLPPTRRFTIQKLVINSNGLEFRRRDIQRDLQQAHQQMENQREVADGYLQRISQAFKQCESIKQEKKQLDDQIVTARIKLSPAFAIPKEAQTLYQQRDFTQQELTRCEDRILAARQADLPRLFREREGLKAQLARIDQALQKKLPPPAAAAAANSDAELDALVNQWWEKRKQEARAVSEVQSLTRLLQQTLDDIERVKSRVSQLEFENKQLAPDGLPLLRGVTVSADGQPVYQAEWQGAHGELERLNGQLREMESAVPELKKTKDQLLARFQTSADEASRLLAQLHGDSVSQGTGKTAMLKDLFLNRGEIFNNARSQAAIEFSMNAYEVFVEGWRKGGPVGALAETMNKVVTAKMQERLDEALDDGQAEPGELDYWSGNEILKTGLYRGLEETVNRRMRDFGQRTVGVQLFKALRYVERRRFISSVGVVTPAALRAMARRLERHGSELAHLSKPQAYGARDLATGVLKDAIKNTLKQLAQDQENAAWKAFVLAEAAQINLYKDYRQSADLYWQGFDELERLRQQRDTLARGWDPNTGFRILRNQPFSNRANLTIQVLLGSAQGHKESILLGGTSAQPAQAHFFRLNAGAIPASGSDPGPIELHILQE